MSAYGFNEDKSKARIVPEYTTFNSSEYGRNIANIFQAIFDYINGHVFSAFAMFYDYGINEWAETQFSCEYNATGGEPSTLSKIEITAWDWGNDNDGNGVYPICKKVVLYKTRTDDTYWIWQITTKYKGSTPQITETRHTQIDRNEELKVRVYRF